MVAYQERVNRVRKLMSESNIDALMLMSEANMRYVSGYSGIALERMISLIISRHDDIVVMIMPKMEEKRAEEACKLKNIEFLTYTDIEDPINLLEKVLINRRTTVLGVEGTTCFRYILPLLKRFPKIKLSIIDDMLYSLRVIKDEYEIDMLKQAAEINNAIMRSAIQSLKPGISEKSFAANVRELAFERGVEDAPFVLIQSGENSALPHQEPTTRIIQDGDIVILDIGIRFNGYFSDITRTVVCGTPSDEHLRIFDIVLKAQQNALRTIKSGVMICEIDDAARKVIELSGYGGYFLHRTGHGIGLEIHEPPYINSQNKQLLRDGMAFTIEPGIYLPDKFGIRIEDNVILIRGQLINLTELPKSIHPEDYFT